jgi:hypothetical protein
MATIDRIRVLVVHDDPVARAGLSAAFSRCADFELEEDDASLSTETSMTIRPGPCTVDVVVADYSHEAPSRPALRGNLLPRTGRSRDRRRKRSRVGDPQRP